MFWEHSGHCWTVLWAHQLYFLSSRIQIMGPRMLPATESTPNAGVNAWHESLYGSMGGISPLHILTPGYAGWLGLSVIWLPSGCTCFHGLWLPLCPSPWQDFILFDFWTFPMLIGIKWTILLILICISDSWCIRVPVAHGQSSWHIKSTMTISKT